MNEEYEDAFLRVWDAVKILQSRSTYLESVSKILTSFAGRREADQEDLVERIVDLEDQISDLAGRERAIWSEIKDTRERVAELLHGRGAVDRGAYPQPDKMIGASGGKAPGNLLTFLSSVNGCVDCDPDGTVRVIFCEETAIPAETIDEAAAYLRRYDPTGKISIDADGGIVVTLKPTTTEED